MKLRTGFVSNSSSSSFCVLGCYISEELYYNLSDEHKELLRKYNIDEHGNPDSWSNETMVGREYSSIRGDETGNEFHESTERIMKQVFGENITISRHEEGWYDG